VSLSRRLAFRVEYDGTDYHGWQVQPGGISTIQQTLIDAVTKLVGHPVRVDGASRTDAGVHALDQLAAVTIEHPISTHGFVKAVNRRLPDSIAIREAVEVAPDFSPRFANSGKVYCYRILRSRVRCPLLERTHWRLHWPLDLERIAAAVPCLVGTHDFSSFAASDRSQKTSERTLWRISMDPGPRNTLCIRVSGSAFLKHMVRNLVGTLVDIARGHIEPEAMATILAAKDRRCAGRTAPGLGLTLERMLEVRLQADVEVDVGGRGVADHVQEVGGDYEG